jgi:NADP-dependent 3-hydroxy acid dehydrogenase YdfG
MTAAHEPVSGRVVAITGAARGIGRATAEAITGQGGRVAIGDVDVELAQATAGELGGSTIAAGLDVRDVESFNAFLDEVQERLGPLDVLINNAGIMPLGPFGEESLEITARIIDINVRGVLIGSRLALDRMLPRGRGHIVNVASGAGKIGFAGAASYCASKHAVVGLSASLVEELHETDVEVTCVMPAPVRTELLSGLPSPRLLKIADPSDVAAAIVGALERPRRNVYVPPSAAAFAVLGMLPLGVRHRVERLLGLEKAFLRADPVQRAAYDARVSGDPAVKASGPPTR